MKFSKLKVGEILSESSHYVLKRIIGDTVYLQPDHGEEITVNKAYVEGQLLTSGEQSDAEQEINRTDAIALLTSNPYVAMTVNFNKKVDPKEIEKEIVLAHENSAPKDFAKAVKVAIKNALIGEERTMVGFHRGTFDGFGRLHFIDMKLPRERQDYDDRSRLVDPRTLNFIILRDVKYIVK